MLESLNNLDTQLFLFFNGLHSPFWDQVMWWASGKLNWIPLYTVLLAYLVVIFRWKAGWIVLGVALLITMSDQASVHLFKETFERLRPCHQPHLAGMIHLVNDYCGGPYGFVSSHSSNHFAVAVFTSLWIRRSWYWALALLWAAMIAYSRVYLGVHFPGDIIGGALLGSLLAWGVYQLMINIPALRLKD
jgi:undecaprenyl-diphosphatase